MKEQAIADLLTHPWAILPSYFQILADALTEIRATDYEARTTVRVPRGSGAISVIPIHGVIEQRMTLLAMIFGGVSTIAVGQQIEAAVANPDVKAIILDVDSPGGSVYGVPELTAQVLAAREKKPIVAVADGLMASAAYWIGSSASEIVLTPSGQIGSIGVIAAHENVKAMLEQMGVDLTIISAGKYKAEANPYEELSKEGKEHLQKRVDEYYGMFVTAVAKGRDVPVADVRNGFGQGRVVGAQEAIKQGMADKVGTFDATLRRFGVPDVKGPVRSEEPTEGMANIVEIRRRRFSLVTAGLTES